MSDQRTNERFEKFSDSARRLCPAVLFILLLASIAGCAKAPVKTPVVKAGGEVLVGAHVDANGRMAVFRGIPYAAPPVGKLRWRPPEPHVLPS